MRGARALALSVGIAFAVACSVVRAADPPLLRTLREVLFDSYQRIRPRTYRPLPVRIVDIDEASLRQLGQWPWPRSLVARLVERLGALGAATIAFDMVMPEPDRLSPAAVLRDPQVSAALGPAAAGDLAKRLPDTDQELAAAIEGRPVVLGFATRPSPDGKRPGLRAGMAYTDIDPTPAVPHFGSAVVNVPELERDATGIGAISVAPQDDEGILRHVVLLWTDGTRLYPSLSLEALRVAQGESTIVIRSFPQPPAAVEAVRIGEVEWPVTRTGEMRLHYTHDVPDRYVSAARILAGDDSVRHLIEGNIVLVGTSAAGLLDMRVTPLRETVPGVSVHAQAIEQILAGDHLVRPDWMDALETWLTLLVGVAVALVTVFTGPLSAFAVGGVLAATAVAGSWWAFSQAGLLLDPLFAVGAGLALHFALTSFRYLVTDRDKRFVRRAFGRYLSPSLLAELERDPRALRLGGEEREMTILFMDIRGFTTLSHALSPTRLVEFLNLILGQLSQDIVDEAGAIDKYIGDSIMAFWNAPVAVPDHALHACRAALRMRASMEAMNASDAFGLRAAGLASEPVQVGVGLNTGHACVGNVGSQHRFNYSAVGDAVNVASRIESLCKSFGFDLLAADSVRQLAPQLAWLDGGGIELRGRVGETRVMLLVGDEEMAASPAFLSLARQHEALIQAAGARDEAGFALALRACRTLARQDFPVLAAFYESAAVRLAPLPREAVIVQRSPPGRAASAPGA